MLNKYTDIMPQSDIVSTWNNLANQSEWAIWMQKSCICILVIFAGDGILCSNFIIIIIIKLFLGVLYAL